MSTTVHESIGWTRNATNSSPRFSRNSSWHLSRDQPSRLLSDPKPAESPVTTASTMSERLSPSAPGNTNRRRFTQASRRSPRVHAAATRRLPNCPSVSTTPGSTPRYRENIEAPISSNAPGSTSLTLARLLHVKHTTDGSSDSERIPGELSRPRHAGAPLPAATNSDNGHSESPHRHALRLPVRNKQPATQLEHGIRIRLRAWCLASSASSSS